MWTVRCGPESRKSGLCRTARCCRISGSPPPRSARCCAARSKESGTAPTRSARVRSTSASNSTSATGTTSFRRFRSPRKRENRSAWMRFRGFSPRPCRSRSTGPTGSGSRRSTGTRPPASGSGTLQSWPKRPSGRTCRRVTSSHSAEKSRAWRRRMRISPVRSCWRSS